MNKSDSSHTAPYEFAVLVSNLDFSYPNSGLTTKKILKNVNLKLKPGSRCILSGDNGAGKTTLLRLLGGKHLHPKEAIKIAGRSAFYDKELNHESRFISSYWAQRSMAFTAYKVPLEADIAVRNMCQDLQNEFSDRRDELVKILDIDMDWRMNKVSDGQRRRVQLMISLMRPFSVLLLDEVTTDLDVVTRSDFLSYLKKECDERLVTIVYATHIFEGLESWATDLVYMFGGEVKVNDKLANIEEFNSLIRTGATSPLMRFVEQRIRKDRTEAKANGDMELEHSRKGSAQVANHIPDGSAGGYAGGRGGRFYNYYG